MRPPRASAGSRRTAHSHRCALPSLPTNGCLPGCPRLSKAYIAHSIHHRLANRTLLLKKVGTSHADQLSGVNERNIMLSAISELFPDEASVTPPGGKAARTRCGRTHRPDGPGSRSRGGVNRAHWLIDRGRSANRRQRLHNGTPRPANPRFGGIRPSAVRTSPTPPAIAAARGKAMTPSLPRTSETTSLRMAMGVSFSRDRFVRLSSSGRGFSDDHRQPPTAGRRRDEESVGIGLWPICRMAGQPCEPSGGSGSARAIRR